ncbi:MAG TPA: DUF305 domain-containing protein [Jiangellaceae bacterium]
MIRKSLATIALAIVASSAFVGCSGDEDYNDADVMFAQGMIPHHAQALEMAQLVQGRDAGQEVTDLAAQIEAAQDPEIQLMTGWLENWGEDVPDLTLDHSAMDHGKGMMTADQMAALDDATASEFDRMFLELMIEHHEGAIAMSKTELADGADKEAKELAQEIIDGQQAEIDHMRELLDRG